MTRYVLLFCLLWAGCGLSAQEVIILAANAFGIDAEQKLILARAPLAALNAETNTVFSRLRAGNRDFRFTTPSVNLRYGKPYRVEENGQSYELHFTQLPLITITGPTSIPDEPKVSARLSYADDEQTISSRIGIELRGKTSLKFPKKTFDIEFREENSDESVNVRFGHLRSDDDWILDALYNEPQRVNAYLAHRLWLDVNSSPWLPEDDRARSGADVQFVELFRNGRYAGVYLLSEQIDRKLLRIKKPTADGEARGLLFKGVQHGPATDMIGVPPGRKKNAEEWGGYELAYPDASRNDPWRALYELNGFVVNSCDANFKRDFAKYFYVDNVVDYFIFLNVVAGIDNEGKNIYLARPDVDEPFFLVPWDLDATFSNSYDGRNAAVPLNHVYGNGLTRRLLRLAPDDFTASVCARYTELKVRGLLSPEALRQRYRRASAYLEENGVYARERLRYSESLRFTPEQTNFTTNWIERRLAFLDGYFCSLATPEAPPATALDRVTIFPNPSAGRVTVTVPGGCLGPYALYDADGRLVRKGVSGSETSWLDLTSFPPGVYTLRFAGEVRRIVLL